MTDYYPLLSRAVTGLERNTGENRRALYERARTALLAQLRSADPPLSESEITRERLTLEEAVRKVEAEAVRKLREDGQPGTPGGAARRPGRPEGAGAAAPRAERPAAPPSLEPAARASAGSAGRREREPGRPGVRQDAPEAPSFASENGPRSGSGGRDPRERVGGADRAAPAGPGLPKAVGLDAVSERPPPRPPERPAAAPPRPQVGSTPAATPAGGASMPEGISAAPPPGSAEDGAPPIAPRPPRPLPRRPAYQLEEPANPARRGLIAALLSVLVFAGLAGAAYWQRDRLTELFGAVRNTAQQAQRDPAQTRPKIADRVGQPGEAPATGAQAPGPGAATRPSGPVPAVAQRVVLYEEDPANPEGNRYVGSALWRTETVSPGPGLSPELAIRADVELPERKMGMTLSIRRNTDQALPASHTVEIMFNLPPDFPFGGVANVPGLLMKESEQSRGAPLSGLAVKVTSGFFLVGLSSAEADLQRNLQLLKERSWFDIPVVYNNGRRAILAVEKGNPGERAFAEAFAAWGNK